MEIAEKEYIEVGTHEFTKAGRRFRYPVKWFFDEPLFIGVVWREYLIGDRLYMPDVEWAANLQLPSVCYRQ